MKMNVLAKYTSFGVSKRGNGQKFAIKTLKRLAKVMKSKNNFDKKARYAVKVIIERVK